MVKQFTILRWFYVDSTVRIFEQNFWTAFLENLAIVLKLASNFSFSQYRLDTQFFHFLILFLKLKHQKF